MGSDKIFMFDNPAAGESAGIMSMIPALLQNKGLDPNLVAAYKRTGIRWVQPNTSFPFLF